MYSRAKSSPEGSTVSKQLDVAGELARAITESVECLSLWTDAGRAEGGGAASDGGGVSHRKRRFCLLRSNPAAALSSSSSSSSSAESRPWSWSLSSVTKKLMYLTARRRISFLLSFLSGGCVGMSFLSSEKAPFTFCCRQRSRLLVKTRRAIF
ncbi:hypothetical protein EYF80_006151 [Liparis tanakae]|uniref:Uncharacterized protein n=1 Tax=Liparis tanakae TaxID=230148 RepID=A0A4Z2J2C8_9TELE|nr:hypothetical protein EYF80_006151 [Liparis tanakae]